MADNVRPNHPAWLLAETRQRQTATRRQRLIKALRMAAAIIVVDGLLLATLLVSNGILR